MIVRIPVFLTLAALVCVTPSVAQDSPAVAELYGSGVHAYFDNDLNTAIELFSQAIASNTKDPRVYYFRGMALRQMGRLEEARQDLEIGASLEVADADGYYPVDQSIERLQGNGRIALEKHRRQARFAAVQETRRSNQQRYEATQRAESEVLRKRFEFGTEQLGVQPAGGETPTTSDPRLPENTDPAEEAVRNAPPVDIPALEPEPRLEAAEERVIPESDPGDSPFGEEAVPESDEPPDPFGGEDAGDDPFGGSGDDVDEMNESSDTDESGSEPDPFGAETETSDATTDPFGEGDAETADPFGESGEGEDSAPSAEDEANPFSSTTDPSGTTPASDDDAAPSTATPPKSGQGKIKAGELVGILGRAIGGVTPSLPTPPGLPIGGESPPVRAEGRTAEGAVEGAGPPEGDPFFGEAAAGEQPDPFGIDDAESSTEDAGEMEDNPFAEDAEEVDPFAESDDEVDPFAEPSSPAEDEADPFFTPDPEEESDPFAEPAQDGALDPPADDDDPFGN